MMKHPTQRPKHYQNYKTGNLESDDGTELGRRQLNWIAATLATLAALGVLYWLVA